MSAYAQCSGFQIVADKSSVCAPDIITYRVLNPVAGSTYEWNVGNGTVYGVDTLFAFYTKAITVDAVVKITLPNGSVCTVTENDIVKVNPNPVPSFIASRYALCNGPDTIQLWDNTPNSASRSWIVDGSNYNKTGDTITHKFVSYGKKDVSLIVTDSNGCKGVASFKDAIEVYKDLDFDFVADVRSGCIPQSVNYTITSNPNGNFTKQFRWTFPGASDTNYNGIKPTNRLYNQVGVFPATLTVDLSNGCSYNVTKRNYLRFGDTVDLDVVPSKTVYCSNETITLSQQNQPISGTTTWSYSGIPVSSVSGGKYNQSIVLDSSGFLSVTVTHNYTGCITTKTYTDLIEVNGVKADFTSTDYYHCEVPHTVHLANRSDSLDASSLTYKWRILDGNTEVYTSFNENDSFSFYTMPASYDVQLIAIGNNGCIDTITRPDFIYQDSLQLEFFASPAIACVDQVIQLNNSTRRSSYQSPDDFKWYFYDLDGTTILDSSDLVNPTISYSDTGYYNIQLTGKNGIGCRDTLLKLNEIYVTNISSSYTISDTIVCSGDSVQLISTSSPADADFTHKWIFELKNGTQTFTYFGDTLKVAPTALGEYRLIYDLSIQGGCTIRDTSSFIVNGVSIDFGGDSISACAQYNLNMDPILLEDVHIGNPDSTYTYDWSLDSYAGVTIDDSTIFDPNLTFSQNGDYKLSLVTTNSVGCQQTDTLKINLIGVKAGFIFDDNKVCVGDTIKALDISYNGVTGTEWTLLPDNEVLNPIIDTANITFKAFEPGVYEIMQIVTKDSNCFDTLISPFEVIDVKAEFIATDSFLNCAPVYAEFESLSTSADSLFWDFGDGTSNKTETNSAGHIYLKNTGWNSGYDIQLIAFSNEGCSDTMLKEDYILVKGPLPEFEMINNEGCEPLEVTFIDKSIDGSSFFMNYNDGSSLDSSKVDSLIGVHTYYNENPNNVSYYVIPSMIVYDSLGCAAVYTPEDTIFIYKKPIAQPVFPNGTAFCPPFNLQFLDTGRFNTSWKWSLDDIPISLLYYDSVTLPDVGTYNLSLIALTSFSCADTVNQEIEVFTVPEIAMSISDTLCINNAVSFEGLLSGNGTILNYRWDFGEPGTPGNTNTSTLNPSFTYATPGVKNVTLVAGSENGCSDSLTESLEIYPADSIDNPQINYVSFIDNYRVEINYEQSQYEKFGSYIIERSGTINQIVNDVAYTSIIDDLGGEPNTTSCYTLKVRDYCDLEGLYSSPHCFITLAASSVNAYENILSWTHYQGWPSVLEYAIYREDENGVFVRIATVNGDVTTYVDAGLCDIEYRYYVEAQHPSESWTSKSYWVAQRPLYLANTETSSIKNVTVSDVNQITITWNSSTYNRFGSYVLRKYQDDESLLLSEIELTDTFYIDNSVLTSEHSYIYRVTEKDICGVENSSDREGKSILLKGRYKDGSRLSWTPYVNWLTGVKFYKIEILKPQGFEYLVTNGEQDRDYTDTRFHKDIFGEYCYRVYGFNEEGDTSYSNTVCVFGDPEAVIPSAFSPNGDGLNDVFRPIGKFLMDGIIEGEGSFSFNVYNRWGEIVFSTNNLYQGWDGMYRGEPCQQGAYIFTFTVQGITKKIIHHSGTVTLVR